jgi:hypothetical protein
MLPGAARSLRDTLAPGYAQVLLRSMEASFSLLSTLDSATLCAFQRTLCSCLGCVDWRRSPELALGAPFAAVVRGELLARFPLWAALLALRTPVNLAYSPGAANS